MSAFFTKTVITRLRFCAVLVVAAISGCSSGGTGGGPQVVTDPVLLALDGTYNVTNSTTNTQMIIADGLLTGITENGTPLPLEARTATLNGTEITWKSVIVVSDPSIPFPLELEVFVRVTDQGGGTLTGVSFSGAGGQTGAEQPITLVRQ